jgi:hypothetical protein
LRDGSQRAPSDAFSKDGPAAIRVEFPPASNDQEGPDSPVRHARFGLAMRAVTNRRPHTPGPRLLCVSPVRRRKRSYALKDGSAWGLALRGSTAPIGSPSGSDGIGLLRRLAHRLAGRRPCEERMRVDRSTRTASDGTVVAKEVPRAPTRRSPRFDRPPGRGLCRAHGLCGTWPRW